MPENRGFTYAERRTEEHVDEQLQHRTEESRDGRDSSYDAANQHLVKFHNELKNINEDAALEFEKQKNPAEYGLEERKEALEAHLEAFRSTGWKDDSERREAADDIAQSVFQPMYPRISLADAASQYQLPQQFLEELQNENIEYLEVKLDDEGNERLEMRAKDIETAQRLVEASQGSFQVSSTRQMDHCRDQFADALYDSNGTSLERMNDALEKGVELYDGRADWTKFTCPQCGHQDNAGGIGGCSQCGAKEGEEKLEASYREKLAFDNLRGMDEFSLEEAVRGMVSQKLFHMQGYSDFVRDEEDGDEAQVILDINETLHEMAQEGIRSSIEQGNEDRFVEITRILEEASTDLAVDMRANAGFVTSEGYESPRPPGGDYDRNQMHRQLAANTMELAAEHRDGMNPLSYQIMEKLNGKLQTQSDIMERWTAEAEQNPEDLLDPGMETEYRNDLKRQEELANAMQYLMRARDGEFWAISKMEEGELEEYTSNLVEKIIRDRLAEHDIEQMDGRYQLDGPQSVILDRLSREAERELVENIEYGPAAAPEHNEILRRTQERVERYLNILETGEQPIIMDGTFHRGPGRLEDFDPESAGPNELMRIHEDYGRQAVILMQCFDANMNGEMHGGNDDENKMFWNLIDEYDDARCKFGNEKDPLKWREISVTMQDTADAIHSIVAHQPKGRVPTTQAPAP